MRQLHGYGGDRDARGLYDEAMRKYGNMSEDALVGTLIEMVHEQKRRGEFDEVQLLGFVNTITPHLSEAQRKRLESVLGML